MGHLYHVFFSLVLLMAALAWPSPGQRPLQCEHANGSAVQEAVETTLENLERDMQKLENTLSFLKKLGDDVKLLKEEVDEASRLREDGRTSSDNATDCRDVLLSGQQNEGVYRIYPKKGSSFLVYCRDGWTYIMNREDGQELFNRSWSDYQYGFGNLRKDHWIGLDNMHALTTSKKYHLRFEISLDFKHQDFQKKWGQFNDFVVDSAEELYRMTFRGRSTSAWNNNYYNFFTYANGMRFTTYDFDNDNYFGNCAQSHNNAGWWYAHCDYSLTTRQVASYCTNGNTVCARVTGNIAVRAAKMMLFPAA